MEQINDLLHYKGLKIVQNDEWFKFSIDSVLLANFATVNLRMNNILDMCCGNAPVPMILSTRTKRKIIGVELQDKVYDLAVKSVRLNGLDDRIEIINYDVRKLCDKYLCDSFDLITCNPPYFKIEDESIVNDNSIKSVARHEIMLNLDDLFKVSSKLLKNGGIISIVHRPERFIEIIEVMKKYSIEPKRVKFVYPKYGRNANILLIEGIKNGNSSLKIESPLYIYDENGYTTSFKKYIGEDLWVRRVMMENLHYI